MSIVQAFRFFQGSELNQLYGSREHVLAYHLCPRRATKPALERLQIVRYHLRIVSIHSGTASFSACWLIFDLSS